MSSILASPKVIVICEPCCVGIQHAPVNSGLISTVRCAFPGIPIRVFAEGAHLEEVKTLLDLSLQPKITFECIGLPGRRAQFFQRLRVELKILNRLMKTALEESGFVLLLSAIDSTMLAVQLWQSLPYRSVPVQAVMHGYLNDIRGWRSHNPLVRSLDLRSALTRGINRNMQYLVLERSIARELVRILPKLEGSVEWISHPFPEREGTVLESIPTLPLKVGFLGLATFEKGFDVFLAAAHHLAEDINSGQVEFHAIGRRATNTPTEGLSVLAQAPRQQGLERLEYIESVRQLHYTCFPYQTRHYELSASGALLDAIAWSKPIIALRSPSLSDLFATHPGIGHLCETPEQMMACIARLAAHFDETAYLKQVEAMRVLRGEREPHALAARYRSFTKKFVGI